MNGRENGSVKWFNSEKGFGFLERDNGSELFVHYTAIRGRGYRALEEGQRVEFVVAENERGPFAQDVVLASKN